MQTFTTTGYGEDAPWASPQMNLLMVVMRLAGIGLILSAVDVFVVPWLQRALRPSAPTAVSDRAGHGDSGRAAAEVLRETQAMVTVLDRDEHEGVDVTGDAREPEVLRAAGIETASVLIIAVDDDTATSATLIAHDLSPELQILVRAQEEDAV